MKEFLNNPYSFMTGRDPFIRIKSVDMPTGNSGAEIIFENHHEGFIGIPHGGVAMGLCLDIWRNLEGSQYPVQVSFRFAGSGISIGDRAALEIEPGFETGANGLTLKITKTGDRKPYLRASFSKASGVVPQLGSKPDSEKFRPLPYYKNCLVCGHSRSIVGLQRQFRYHEINGEKTVSVLWGKHDVDFDRAGYFLIGEDELHPFVLIAIFDENTAWGGFMETRRAGLSVKLDFFIKRPIMRKEKLLFIGRPAGIRGAPASPRFFSANGQIVSMSDPNNPEIVAHGWGEWVVISQYTEQIKSNLIPKSDLDWIFG